MGQLTQVDGGDAAHRFSTTALNALTRILASELEGSNILVNAVDPDWVRPDMGGSNAPRRVARGAADTVVWLATLPDGAETGVFCRDASPFPG